VIRTVDLVIAGDGRAARAAAVHALREGRRVLVVLRGGRTARGRRLRRCLSRTANAAAGQLTVVTGASVVCVDGLAGVEAVVIRYSRSGRVCAVNASAFLARDGRRTRGRRCGIDSGSSIRR
jgi:hypothetical protein